MAESSAQWIRGGAHPTAWLNVECIESIQIREGNTDDRLSNLIKEVFIIIIGGGRRLQGLVLVIISATRYARKHADGATTLRRVFDGRKSRAGEDL